MKTGHTIQDVVEDIEKNKKNIEKEALKGFSLIQIIRKVFDNRYNYSTFSVAFQHVYKMSFTNYKHNLEEQMYDINKINRSSRGGGFRHADKSL